MKERGGLVLMVAGAAIAIVGVIGTLASGGGDETPDTTVTTTTVPPATATTTTVVTSTTRLDTTTTASAPTSTTTSSTTTTTVAPESVEAFVSAFGAALELGDRIFVRQSLHPVVIEGWGEELCESWIDREIMTLSDYTLVSVDSGPETRTVNTPAGPLSVENFFDASVSFMFEGQQFDQGGSFARIGPNMYWLGQCR
jgi:hypothetical protein